MPSSHQPSGRAAPNALRPFLVRLHFYIGLFVGPFLFIAALSGMLYVLTPQIEQRLYADALFTDQTGAAQPLTAQAEAARSYLDHALNVSAVRPAPAAGQTTRVLFSDATLGPSENRTIFVDPVTLTIRGDMTTYGTSGILPFRTTLDYLHRNLMLGDWGRYYSEVAASWLWVVVLGGVALWATGPRRRRAVAAMPPAQRRRWIHSSLGVTAGAGLLFLSVTGLTWSQAAGARIDSLRGALGLVTPSVSLALDAPDTAVTHDHHHHRAPDLTAREDRLADLDAVAEAARAAGIDSPFMEIRLPKPDQAWSVREYDRSWPTQVDAIALHPNTLDVTSRADFDSFAIVSKLIRWGIDLHMGVLFGLPNQILMALIAAALMVAIVYGYVLWWQRRPAAGEPLSTAWSRLPIKARITWILVACAVSWALPVLGVSLGLFLVVDLLRCLAAHQAARRVS
ncbi:PepSY-associated TM helix domain-containing protein [Paracoccus rhizosphaerae]|uniref:PepSY-associated TM helix domain-containing protein n=1 Tax=Paracoccus rhizosphaerae TaxID=1133347 RepID=A0ABV6CG70_9RHOB|nr:PepSY-associated TM helix domain-containing protein [Paracoccus rhizosphaerae]